MTEHIKYIRSMSALPMSALKILINNIISVYSGDAVVNPIDGVTNNNKNFEFLLFSFEF